MSTEKRANDLKFHLDRAIGYHSMRAGHYNRWHKRAMLAVVLALFVPAFALIEPLTNVLNVPLAWFDLSVSVTAVASIVGIGGVASAVADILVDPSDRSGQHRATEMIYQSIKNDSVGNLSDLDIDQLEARYERVDSGFEDRRVIVNVVSANRVARVTNREQVHVPDWKRWLMHYFVFSSTKIDQ